MTFTQTAPVFGGQTATADPRDRRQVIRLAPPLFGDAGIVTLALGNVFYPDPGTGRLEIGLGAGLTQVSGSPYKVAVKHDGTLKVLPDGTLTVQITSDRVFDPSGQRTLTQQVAVMQRREAALEAATDVLDERMDQEQRAGRVRARQRVSERASYRAVERTSFR